MGTHNPILARLSGPLGAGPQPEAVDPVWLFTLFSVLELDRYPLETWNEALSAVLGRRICCPSYRALSRRLEEAARQGRPERASG